ncbi:hypothetical protein VE03_03985 [Pseudogymnoascus sp. 23342-1-I1]|nr:hypothetical protein VE03_03985 [Pseudogymnoascus sp. 23342-1-I1]
MDHGSTEWKDALLEVTLAMNTQIHSTIGQARKDLSIGVEQEDPTMGPIFESQLEPEAQIYPQLRQLPGFNSEPSSGSKLNSELEIELRIESSHSEPELNSKLWQPAPTRAQCLSPESSLSTQGLVPSLELEPSSIERQSLELN